MCSKSLNKLAQPLPMAHCANSRLVCKISGEVMNENNPPMMLPNGYVYGYNVSTLEIRAASDHEVPSNVMIWFFSSTSPFCPFAKMTKWFVPEPKKSSTSLRRRRSTSCDRLHGLSVKKIKYGPESISCDQVCPEPTVELWSSALPPFAGLQRPFATRWSSAPHPLPFLPHRYWALLLSGCFRCD